MKGLIDRAADAGFAVRKTAYQRLHSTAGEEKPVLLIVGCQRSGTTLLSDVFERDLRSVVFRERSRLSSMDYDRNIRWNPLDDVANHFRRARGHYVVAKPLVETQRCREILGRFPNARVIFIYRNYRDVAASDLLAFRNQSGRGNLRPIVDRDSTNWRSEGCSSEVRDIVCRYFSDRMPSSDAAALFWLARNDLFFGQNLHDQDRVRLCKYERFVEDPAGELAVLGRWANLDLNVSQMVRRVHASSVRKGASTSIHSEIEGLCERLLVRLDDAEGRQVHARGG